ncbi:MAG: hypothetical protein ACKPKO_20350, partial [Candidatus Fonsibacter sp.]
MADLHKQRVLDVPKKCLRNIRLIVVATGDTDQLECINCITNQNNYDEYYNKCVDMIFPVRMFLKENQEAQEQEGQRDAQEVQAGHIRRERTRLPDHRQILQDGQ